MTDAGKQADCPVCRQPQPGPHTLDCHFKGMDKIRKITAFIPTIRLSPKGDSYICSLCDLEWKPNTTPPCTDCLEMWRLIDAN